MVVIPKLSKLIASQHMLASPEEAVPSWLESVCLLLSVTGWRAKHTKYHYESFTSL